MTKPKITEPNIIDVHVGARVRLARIETNVTQMELAAALGVTFQQVQKYEKGTNRVSASVLFKIACTLEKPIDYFYEDAPLPVEKKSLAKLKSGGHQFRPDFATSAEGVRLIKAFTRISSKPLRSRVIALAKSIGERKLAKASKASKSSKSSKTAKA